MEIAFQTIVLCWALFTAMLCRNEKYALMAWIVVFTALMIALGQGWVQ